MKVRHLVLAVVSLVIILMGLLPAAIVGADAPGQTWYINGDFNDYNGYLRLTTNPNTPVDTTWYHYTWGYQYNRYMGADQDYSFPAGTWNGHVTFNHEMSGGIDFGIGKFDSDNWYPGTVLGSQHFVLDHATGVDLAIPVSAFTLRTNGDIFLFWQFNPSKSDYMWIRPGGTATWITSPPGSPILRSLPAITTLAATGITSTSATLNSNLTHTGGASSVDVAFYYDTDDYPFDGPVTSTQSVTSTGAVGIPVTGLTPDTLYYFQARAIVGANSNYSRTVLSFRTLPDHYTLTMAANPVGGGTVSPAAGAHQYTPGTVVDISATANAFWHFVNWTGAVADPASATTTVTVDANKTVTANFAENPLEVDLAISKADTPDPVVVGQEDIIYTLTVSNDIPSIVFSGPRAQAGRFNVAKASLPTVGAKQTQGWLAENPLGPIEPWYGSWAYNNVGSPKPGTSPYGAYSTSITGFASLEGYSPDQLAYDAQGLVIEKSNVQDLRGEGNLPDSDARFQQTNILFYYWNSSHERSEKRTYTGGTFTLRNRATGAAVATGTVDYMTLLLDYDHADSTGWGEGTVSPGSALYDELMARYGNAKLSSIGITNLAPIFDDSPAGTPFAQTYAVYDTAFTLVPSGTRGASPSGVATGVVVTDTLSNKTSFVSAAPSQGACGHAAGVVTCNVGTLNPGASATITIRATPVSAGQATNTVTVDADQPDPDASNNTAYTVTTINAPPVLSADLSVIKSDNPDPVNINTWLFYTMVITNNGPDAAQSIVLTDTLPTGAIYQTYDAFGSCSLTSPGVVTCTLDNPLASGASTTVILRVLLTVAGDNVNQVSVASATNDPVPGNNTDTEHTTAQTPPPPPPADLFLSKEDSADPVTVGDALAYTLTVTNGMPFITFSGPRAQQGKFNVAKASLPTVGTKQTQGWLAENPLGPIEPWYGSWAYNNVGSPKPGTAPYAATSTAIAGFTSLVAYAPDGLAYDAEGLTLVKSNVLDLRGEGDLPDNDPRFHQLDNLLYYWSSTHQQSEKRTYTGGTFTLRDKDTGAVVATGIVDYMTLLLDYDHSESTGWGEGTVSPGSALYNELMAKYGNAKLSSIGITNTAPIFDDSPNGTPFAQQYAVYNTEFTLVPFGAPQTQTTTGQATAVVVTDTLSNKTSFVSATASQGTCGHFSGTVTCNLGTIAHASNATVTINVIASASGLATNTASVTSSVSDPDTSNNTASVDTTINAPSDPSADLSVAKTDSADPVNSGETVEYTITVTNNGPDAAQDVVLTDFLPDGATYVSSSNPRDVCSFDSPDMVTCNLGSIAAGDSVAVTIDATLTAAGVNNNQAIVNSSTLDPDTNNNSTIETTTVNTGQPGGYPGTIVDNGDGTFTLTFQPGPGANDGTDQGGIDNGKDTYVLTWADLAIPPASEINHGADPELGHCNSNCNEWQGWSYYQFDISNLPPAPDVTEVKLVLYEEIFRGYGWPYQITPTTMHLFPVTEPWNEMAMTYNNRPTSSLTPAASVDIPTVQENVAYMGFVTVDITDLYKSWRNGTQANYGIAYKRSQPFCENANSNNVFSSDNSDATRRPRLEITYRQQQYPGTIVDNGDGTFTLTFQPGPGANDGTDQGGLNGGKDTTVLNNEDPGTANTNFGDTGHTYHCNSDCNEWWGWSYYQFDVAALPPASEVSKVEWIGYEFIFRGYGWPYQITPTTMQLFPVTEPWNEMTMTYNNRPVSSLTPAASVDIPTDLDGVIEGELNIAYRGFVTVDITDLYKAWKNGTQANYGFAYRRLQPFCENANANNVYTSDYLPDAAKRPQLKITYTPSGAPPAQTTVNIDLVVGLNLLTLPVEPVTPFTAASLIADIASQGGTVTQLDAWEKATGMWKSYKPGTGTLNFPLQMGGGVFLKVTVGTTWRVTGTALTSGVPINLVTGLNLVGIPYSTTPLTAASLLAGIAAQGGNVTQLDMWDETTGMWKSYKPGTGTPNFDIVNWRGYFLKSTATSTYTP